MAGKDGGGAGSEYRGETGFDCIHCLSDIYVRVCSLSKNHCGRSAVDGMVEKGGDMDLCGDDFLQLSPISISLGKKV